jgi:electron transport complex protein RnfG
VYQLTANKIEQSQQQHLLASLNELIPASRYNNALLEDTLTINNQTLLHLDQPQTAYRARFNQQDIAVIFPVIAPNGYSGKIKLLVAIEPNGTLAGVRVLQHKETAGLGDAIDKNKSDWIDVFTQRSLTNTSNSAWQVKRDGGEFDQFTGATITPRAVVKAVHNALLYYQQHQDTLFLPQPSPSLSKQP